MRLDNLRLVNQADDERRATLFQLKLIDAGKLTVAIDGVRQDDVMVELVKPIVVGELRRRVRASEADLEALGVQVV